MIVVSYNSLSNNQRRLFFNFCQEQSKDTSQPAHVNMWEDNWEEQSHTLPYILTKTNRYNSPNGEFNIVFDGESIVGCAGVYKSEFSNIISLAGCRLWISKQYRNLSIARNIILPAHKKWSVDNNCQAVAITFNEYNKNLTRTFKRTRLGESADRIVSREPHHLFFTGMYELDFPVTVQYTKQWLIYEKLHSEFAFNWDTIKWK